MRIFPPCRAFGRHHICNGLFYLGDEAAQAEHEQEMSMGGMMHNDPAGIALEAGQTDELTFTFAQPGSTLAGCHVTGHYGGGMKASISVVAP